jgi:hypothetical protein
MPVDGESSRGLEQSKTLRAFRQTIVPRAASWTAVASYRFIQQYNECAIIEN